MNEITLYLITFGTVAVAIATIYLSVSLYRKKKAALLAEADNLKKCQIKAEQELEKRKKLADEELQRRTEEMQKRQREAEQKAEKKIQLANEDIQRRMDDLEDRIASLNEEQKLRDDISKKSDREIVVEMHIKAKNILETLNSIDQKLEGVKDYSIELENIEDDVTKSISSLKKSLNDSISSIEYELQSSLGDIDSTIRNTISENLTTIDKDDVRDAVSDAVNYDCYSFKSDIEDMVKSAVESEVSSSMSDIDSKLSSIESMIYSLS